MLTTFQAAKYRIYMKEMDSCSTGEKNAIYFVTHAKFIFPIFIYHMTSNGVEQTIFIKMTSAHREIFMHYCIQVNTSSDVREKVDLNV